MAVAEIAEVSFTSDDRVRDVRQRWVETSPLRRAATCALVALEQPPLPSGFANDGQVTGPSSTVDYLCSHQSYTGRRTGSISARSSCS